MDLIKIRPIGIIHSPYTSESKIPFQGIMSDIEFELLIYREYIDGLKDIEGFSHLIVLYYASNAKNLHLQTTTPWDTTLHGVFTTRSPFRPNFLLFSVVQLLKRKDEQTLLVKYLDAMDKTPLIDIKPYIPSLDRKEAVRIGWMTIKIKV